jgi:hypothetical protein
MKLLFRFGFLCALETDDQGNCQGKFFGCLDDAFGDIVAAHDATKDVDEYALHFRIREKDLERLLDRFGRGTSAKPRCEFMLPEMEKECDVTLRRPRSWPVDHRARKGRPSWPSPSQRR